MRKWWKIVWSFKNSYRCNKESSLEEQVMETFIHQQCCPGGSVVKNPPAVQDQTWSWVGKIPWRRKYQPTPEPGRLLFLLAFKSHIQHLILSQPTDFPSVMPNPQNSSLSTGKPWGYRHACTLLRQRVGEQAFIHLTPLSSCDSCSRLTLQLFFFFFDQVAQFVES